MAGARARTAEALRRLNSLLADEGPLGLSAVQVVSDLHGDRR